MHARNSINSNHSEQQQCCMMRASSIRALPRVMARSEIGRGEKMTMITIICFQKEVLYEATRILRVLTSNTVRVVSG